MRSRVITFDYNGLGLSTGEKNYSPILLGQDAHDLIQALGLTELVIGGWSLGGLTAQPVVARYLQRAGHAVLIGTGPSGPLVKPAEQLLYDLKLGARTVTDKYQAAQQAPTFVAIPTVTAAESR